MVYLYVGYTRAGCMCICVYASVCVCAGTCMCLWRLEVHLECCSSGIIHFGFWNSQSFMGTRGSSVSLDWLEAPETHQCIPASPAEDVHLAATMPGPFSEFWRLTSGPQTCTVSTTQLRQAPPVP